MRFGYVFLASYWTVFVAEVIGDKSIYTVASLSARLRAGLVVAGMMVAFGGKMLVAVVLGQALVQVSPRWSTIVSALVFFSTALFIWLKKPERGTGAESATTRSRTVLVPFVSLFFSEWGDPGQLSAAALTSQYQLPLATWLGGTLALLTKGAFALSIGRRFGSRVPEPTLRLIAATSCCALGFLSVRDAVMI